MFEWKLSVNSFSIYFKDNSLVFKNTWPIQDAFYEYWVGKLKQERGDNWGWIYNYFQCGKVKLSPSYKFWKLKWYLRRSNTGCLKKKGDLFYDQYFHQIKHKAAGYIFYLKDGIQSSVWSTKKILYDIREPRYKQIKMGYHILQKKGYWTI